MTSGEPIILRQPADLSLEVFEEIVVAGRPLSLHTDLLDRIQDARACMLHALSDGRMVYGVNTGMGYFGGERLGEEEQREHQADLLLGRAVGSGPYLDRMETRGVLLARLGSFLRGHAGVSAALCRFIGDRLNDGFVPLIPGREIGCSGEIIPLAHAFQTFMGVGEVMSSDGYATPAAAALEERGAAPYIPAVKEGVALLAGAPATVALAALHRRSAAILARQLLIASACAIDALRAPLLPYDPAVARLANDPIMARLLDRLGTLLDGSTPDRHTTQAPVSFRVIPQVLTHLERSHLSLEETVRRGLTAVADSPAFVDGSFVTSGLFHAIDLAAGMDSLCVALVQAAELAAQQVHRLLDHRFSGLTDQLAPGPGPGAGLIVVHKRVVGAVNELRRLAAPASIGLADTSLGQEDAMTFSFEVAHKLGRVELLVRDVVACVLLVARQAWALRGEPAAFGLRPYAEVLSALVPAVQHDRPLGNDIGALAELLSSGDFQ